MTTEAFNSENGWRSSVTLILCRSSKSVRIIPKKNNIRLLRVGENVVIALKL